MNWLTRSIRNKILLSAAAGLGLLVVLALISVAQSWDTTQTLEVLLAAMVLSLGMNFWVVQKLISAPAKQLTNDLYRLSKGDFTTPVRYSSDNELGQIASNAERTRSQLAKIMAEANRSATGVLSAIDNLSHTAQAASGHSLEQSSAASATESTLDEMSRTITSVAEITEGIRQHTDEGLELTHKSNEYISQLIGEIEMVGAAVRDIAESVNEFIKSTNTITSMTKQVKEIAEQTNLLALNAAIEAARAGEQGRGFAVVADEVRKLAEKSSTSASEIDSVTKALEQKSGIVEKSIQQGLQSLAAGDDVIESVVMEIGAANQSIRRAKQEIGNISAIVSRQQAVKNEVVDAIGKIVQLAESTSMAISSVSTEANNLNQLAEELRKSLKPL